MRRRSEPLRYLVRKEILDLLEREHYALGDKIPTEQELMGLLNVSRSTLREGLQLLEQERVILTKHGTGRYLTSAPKDYKFDINELLSVTEMLANYGIQVKTKLLSCTTILADQDLASSLEIPLAAPVAAIERIRYAKNVPVIYAIDYIPAEKIPGDINPKEYEGSLFLLLQDRWGLSLDHSSAIVRVVFSDGNVPQEAVADPKVPWVLFEQINYTAEGEPIIFSKDFHRSDYIKFHVTRYRRS